MPRKHGKARKRYIEQPSFKQLSQEIGLNVKQRIIIGRYLKRKDGEQ